jgi:hypothetical protein
MSHNPDTIVQEDRRMKAKTDTVEVPKAVLFFARQVANVRCKNPHPNGTCLAQGRRGRDVCWPCQARMAFRGRITEPFARLAPWIPVEKRIPKGAWLMWIPPGAGKTSHGSADQNKLSEDASRGRRPTVKGKR